MMIDDVKINSFLIPKKIHYEHRLKEYLQCFILFKISHINNNKIISSILESISFELHRNICI